ncbi:glycosyltransferase [Burkholderia ubonensis]|uniref:glycosyltransferase n=1 Tax=Burkholderia ubonensis TaxID=101571 RepID=UPI000753BBAA|nr:glycosyltransferase [Burkholderia ubonensis]AOI69658.1 glycosyl transferase family 1 [Burkholderia ubonensis]KUZ15517.1 glycosyl transferase family 1 [Burkholderia ubonensis]KUZ25278.1 glycosyl transferase family 1 [Burkholderia ubonensis]KUZ32095.1 glycosyl transferase family 1 [Burkholderia ubonensis]KUZ52203.1 glycosyl transferase family 1 [Burkholderia ubonensis]
MAEALQQGLGAGDCVLFSTADWDEPYWTNKQHTARVLAQRGWRVLYVESPGLRAPKIASGKDWARIWRRLWSGLRSNFIGPPQREKNIWVLSPMMFPAKHHWPLVRLFNQSLLKLSVSRFARRHRFTDTVVWTYHPFMLETVENLPRGPLVYHCVDDLAAVPGVDVAAFNRAQEALLRLSDAVFTTAVALRDHCLAFNANTHYFANVVDAQHFGRALDTGPLPPDLADIPGPRLVYHGVLSDFKVDFPLILAAARSRPDWQWVFIGEEREGQRSELVSQLKELPNFHFLGYRSYEELPVYLRGMDVGLLPTLLNDYTRSMFPMKFFEYLAAGLPVVSTPLDFTRDQSGGLAVGGTTEAFVAAIERQLHRGKLTPDESRAYVGDNTWDARTVKMLDYVWRGTRRMKPAQAASEH